MINVFTGALEFHNIQHQNYYFDSNHHPNQQINYDNQNRYYTQIQPHQHVQHPHPLPFQPLPLQQGQINIANQPYPNQINLTSQPYPNQVNITSQPYPNQVNITSQPYPNQPHMIYINTAPQPQPGFISNTDSPVNAGHFRPGSNMPDIYKYGLDSQQYNNTDILQDNQYNNDLCNTDTETDTQMLSIVDEIERDEDSLESQMSELLN
jgi:hypothetical protein